jgi:predicted amidohydrolase YtcJ
MNDETVIYRARKIITMDRSNPVATHVAVRDGRVLAVGGEAQTQAWGPARQDDRFRDLVLLPGFVEGHSHAMTGGVWVATFLGYHGRTDPHGKYWPGCDGVDAVIERLIEAERSMDDPASPLFGWGFDPIYFGLRRMGLAELDRVSTTRPVVVRHSNGHVMSVNSFALQLAGLSRSMNLQGLMRDEKDELTGELKGIPLQYAVNKAVGSFFEPEMETPEPLRLYAREASRNGVTTITDLGNSLTEPTLRNFLSVTKQDDFGLRIVAALWGHTQSAEEGVARLAALMPQAHAKLRFGIVKFVADGSIQGFSARLKWPGYISGAPNGLWYVAPDQLGSLVHAYHAAGFQVHIHTNGDEASEAAIDAVEAALRQTPRFDHRHILQHCQMADSAQFRRMAALGIGANLFANHIYYWGDQHAAYTMGPDKARRMDAVATGLASGVNLAIHSDSPVTPLSPLFTAWCAVNRLTSSGKILGAKERIGVGEALRLITLGAAFTLKMDHLIGSIEVGKWADFAVLEEDPTAVAPEALKDIRVWGTVLGGRLMAA